ncbi:MAG: polysaccharide biosynthesis/export family protein [Gammaproteobacteria bacterium]|nr:polysaccharide biosynthesis/export family protein [Gammaproteobacteria bacterium]
MSIRRLYYFLLALLLGVAVIGCSLDPNKPGQVAGVTGAGPDSATLPKGADARASQAYLIGPGDMLQIFVWGNPDLSTMVPVRPDGRLTTPLVEDIVASGKSPSQLAREMEERLAKYVKNPVVTVIVKEFVGRFSEQVRVVGEATKPQALPYRDHMTLLDLMIAVGGMTEFAAGNKARLVRKVGGKQTEIPINLDALIKSGDISANLDLLPGDILIIPESWF